MACSCWSCRQGNSTNLVEGKCRNCLHSNEAFLHHMRGLTCRMIITRMGSHTTKQFIGIIVSCFRTNLNLLSGDICLPLPVQKLHSLLGDTSWNDEEERLSHTGTGERRWLKMTFAASLWVSYNDASHSTTKAELENQESTAKRQTNNIILPFPKFRINSFSTTSSRSHKRNLMIQKWTERDYFSLGQDLGQHYPSVKAIIFRSSTGIWLFSLNNSVELVVLACWRMEQSPTSNVTSCSPINKPTHSRSLNCRNRQQASRLIIGQWYYMMHIACCFAW